MSKLDRKIQKIFGGSNTDPAGTIAKFGSLKVGTPAYSRDPDVIQELPGYDQGWTGATVRNNIAPLQDMNALQYLFSYQLAYLMQSGVPEWDARQDYYEGSFCNSGGILYVSTQNNNCGNDVSNASYWRPFSPRAIGPKEKRPDSPPVGFIYVDTTLGVELRWTNQGWTTNAGSPGDLKEVIHASIQDALDKNPGWELHKDSVQRAVFGADPDNGSYPPGKKSGSETVTLTVSQMPKHKHDFKFSRDHGNTGGNDAGICSYKNLSSDYVLGSELVKNESKMAKDALVQETGGGQAHENMPPAIYFFRLVKKY